MYRVLVLGCLAVLIFAGGPAWADDPAPPAPPPLPATDVATPSAPVPAPAPTNLATDGRWAEGAVNPGATLIQSMNQDQPIDPDQVLRAAPPGDTVRVLSPWTGSARLRYRLRTTDDSDSYYETDNDVYMFLRVKYRDENLAGWSGSAHARATLDLDDFGDVDGFNVMDSIWDTYSDRLNGRLFHAYANYHFCSGAISDVRFGRMWEDVGEFITYDGIRVESQRFGAKRIGFAAKMGIPYYFYETDRSGNFIAGAQVFGNPWRGAEMGLDWTYFKNADNVYGYQDNHLFNLTWNQRIGRTTLARLQYQHLDDEARSVRATIDATLPDSDVVLRGFFHSLLNYQGEMVYDLDSYYWTALALEPYWTANASASKGIGDCFDVEAGFTMRRLYKYEDIGPYNREFDQYFVAAGSYDWLLPGLSLTLSGEYWDGADDIYTGNFDIEYRPSRTWRFVLGTDYSAYTYDLFADEERENVYSVFGRVGYRPNPRWYFDLRGRVENDDYGMYTIFDATAQWNF